MASIPKGLSPPESEVLKKLIRVAERRKERGQGPRLIVVITDVGKDYDDLAALVVLKEFHRLGLVELRGVVANLMPADKRARFARAALDSLGLRDVPVACGTPGSPEDHEELEHEFSWGDFVVPGDVPQQDGQDLLRNVYLKAKEKGEKLHLLCLSSLQDIHEFASTHAHLVAECTAEVHMQGGNYFSSEGNLEPDRKAANNRLNLAAAAAWHSFIQKNALTSHTYTKDAAFAAPITSDVFVELEATGHPIGAYLRRVQVEQDLAFYKRACESDPEKRFAPFMDQKWFLANKTNWHQRAHAEGDALPTGKEVIPYLTKIVLYDVHAALGVAGRDVVGALKVFQSRDRSIEVESKSQGRVVSVHHWITDGDQSRKVQISLAVSSLLKDSLLYAVPSDTKTSCKVCDSIDFGAAGFYHGYGITLGDELAIDEIWQNSEQCIFCGKIAEFFNDWIRRKFDKQAPDLENAQAFVETYRLTSLELDDKGGPKGCAIRINVRLLVKKPAPSHDWFGPSLRFQKCSQHPLNVRDICDGDSLFDWESGSQEQAYSGRIRPLVADTRLFCKWKESCCAIHGDHCNLIFTGRRLRRLRFIDVENRCVVDNEDDSSYTALSYVWGGATLPLLTKSTDKRFREPGSLSTEMLPSTIDDAIEVTRSLGENYIWVDCLCIKQDDEADKLELIPQMDSIFGFASVTIVAASGVNADVGLPGIKPNSRTREQVPFRIKGASLLATLDPEGSEETNSYLGESVWLTRGWTFQEKIFSSRALIFTKEQVYWECQKASWCEDGLWETTKSPTVYRHCLGEEEFRHPWLSDVDSFERIYRKLVEEFSLRTLTYEKDGLDAFAGILHHFEKQAGQSFLWALPASFLSTALTWPCEFSATRRLDFCTLRSEDGTATLCPFPSWSWVGWVGEVLYVALFLENLKSETVDLIFYHLDGSGLPRIIVQAAAATQSLSQISIRKDDDRTIITREDIPESVLTRSIAPNILFFWSSTAILHVRYEVDQFNAVKPSLRCIGKVVPSLWSHVPLSHPDHEEEAEFVVIGRDPPKRKVDRLALLLVSWEDGVAYRRGLVNIKISDWVELGNRVWKMIILG